MMNMSLMNVYLEVVVMVVVADGGDSVNSC